MVSLSEGHYLCTRRILYAHTATESVNQHDPSQNISGSFTSISPPEIQQETNLAAPFIVYTIGIHLWK